MNDPNHNLDELECPRENSTLPAPPPTMPRIYDEEELESVWERETLPGASVGDPPSAS